MYHPIQIASFAFMHFERGLNGLTEDEAQARLVKADGSETNSISWISAHVAWQWIRLASRAAIARGEGSPDEDPLPELRRRSRRFRHTSDDPTPPTLTEALDLLHDASKANQWILVADDGLMNQIAWGSDATDGPIITRNETLGTSAIRNTLHTWFHIGEINAVRQMLGHKEILFIIMASGNMEWLPGGAPEPAWVDYPPPLAPHDADLIERYNQLLPARS